MRGIVGLEVIMVTDSVFLKVVIQRIYKAVLNPDEILDVIRDIARSINAESSSFEISHKYIGGLSKGKFKPYLNRGVSVEIQNHFESKAFNVIRNRVNTKAYLEAVFFNDGDCFEIRFLKLSEYSATLNHDIYFLNLLYPHFKHFLKLSPLFSVNKDDEFDSNILRYVNRPVWIVNASLQLIYQNHCSFDWMGEEGYFSLFDGYLRSSSEDLDALLSHKIANVSNRGANISAFFIESAQGEGEYLSLEGNRGIESFRLTAIKSKAGSGPCLVMITGRKSLPQIEVIINNYGLTRRQSQLCMLLMQGHSLTSVAKHMEISLNTVRNLLATCFRVLKVGNQSKLIRLLYAGTRLHNSNGKGVV